MTAVPARAAAEGTNSTPAVFALPQIGSAGFTCNRRWKVQPFFDLGSAIATEAVTIRAAPSRDATSPSGRSAGSSAAGWSKKSSRAR